MERKLEGLALLQGEERKGNSTHSKVGGAMYKKMATMERKSEMVGKEHMKERVLSERERHLKVILREKK